MEVKKIDHISIAVNNLEEARKIWEPVLGKSKPDDSYIDEKEKIRVARYWLEDVGLELMESTTLDGEVAKFIKKKGEGLMVLSLFVDNIDNVIRELEAKGYAFIGKPRQFQDCRYTFIHPKQLNGVLLEIIEYPTKQVQE